MSINIKHHIKERMRGFFAKRSPRQDQLTLSVRNVYIFFSKQGLLFAILLIITFIAGINYGNNLVLGVCFYLASVWLISVHITFAHVSRLKLKLLSVSMAAVGEPVWVSIEVTSESRSPSRQLRFVFDDDIYQTWHKQWQSEQGNDKNNDKNDTNNSIDLVHVHVLSKQRQVILPMLKGSAVIRLPVLTDQRGQMTLPRLVIDSVYPLGIMRAWSYAYFATTAWVYPKPLAFEWQKLNKLTQGDDNAFSPNQQKGQDDFEMLDNYQLGESLTRVSWAHVARGHGMLTKHFADPVGQELLLDYADMPAVNHEQKLSQLTHAILQMSEQTEPFVMNLPNDKGQKGMGTDFVRDNLKRLAKAPRL